MLEGKFRAGVNSKIVVAPAAACLKWNTEPSGKVRMIFTYWGGVEKQLPKELQPTHGHEQTPHLVADDAAHAKKLLAAIKAWLTEKHPDLTQKKSKELTRFMSGKTAYWVSAYPEEERMFVLSELYEKGDAIRWNIVGKHPAIAWRSGGECRVRITDDEVRFELDDQFAEHAKHEKLGNLVFDDGMLAAISVDTTFAELREPPASVAALKPLVAKKPATLKGKNGETGDGFVAKIEKGTYAVEAGPDVEAKRRWLSLKRL